MSSAVSSTHGDTYKQLRASHARPGADVLGRKPGYVVPSKDRMEIVTDWTGMSDYMHCPPSYGAFFKQYWGYARWYVAKFVPRDDVEDVAADLMTRFMERDSLGVFSNAWESRSATGRSVFRTYFMHFLLAYCPGKSRNIKKHRQRVWTILDSPVTDDGSVTMQDVVSDPTTIDDQTDFSFLVAEIRSRATPEQAAVVDQLLGLAIGDVKLSRASLAKSLNLQPEAAGELLDSFRDLVRSAVEVG